MNTHVRARGRRLGAFARNMHRESSRSRRRQPVLPTLLLGVCAASLALLVSAGAAPAHRSTDQARAASGTAFTPDYAVEVHRQGQVRKLHHGRVAAEPTPRSLRPSALASSPQAASAPALADASCPNTVTNTKGDRLTLACPDDAVLYIGVGGYWSDCSGAGTIYLGELSTTCFTLDLWDSKLKKNYVPATNTFTQVITDTCGTAVSTITLHNMSGVGPGVPNGYMGSGLWGGFIFRVPPYEPPTCFGTWTITFTFTETFADGKTLTVSSTGPGAIVKQTQVSSGGGAESNGGGNSAELGCYQACSGDPVNTATGNYWRSTADLAIPGRGPGLAMSRTYNSLSAGNASPIGYGWRLSYGMSLVNDPPFATVTNANGSETEFQLAPGGAYIAPPRVLATLIKNGDGTWTYKVRARVTYSFNSAGQLTKIADLNGNATTLAYNGSGQLSTATDGAGRSFTFGYNGSGQLTTVSDTSGRSVSYGYDGAGDLRTVTDVRGHIWQYAYDPSHLLLTERDANGNVVLTNTYDSYKRVLTQTDALTRRTSYAYSDCCGGVVDETTDVTNARGYVTRYEYDTGGQLVKVTRALGTPAAASWMYAYDPYVLGRTSSTDPNNHTNTATYDHQGNVTSTKSALNHTTSATYDSLNDLKSYTDGNGTTSTYTYDTRGNLLTRSTPLLQASPVQYQTVTYGYGDPNHPGDLTSATDPNGKATSYTYDAAGDLASVTDAAGDKTTYTYDPIGRRLTMVSPRGNATGGDPAQHTTRYSYDAAGNALSVTDPLSHATTYTYDNDGNVSTVTDARQNQTAYTYNAANELTQVTRADTSVIKSSYDENGNLASQTDAAEHATTYGYDPLDHESSVTDPLSRTTNYASDAVGNLLSQKDPLNRTTTYTYNPDDELTNIAHSDGSTENVSFGYDNDGKRTSMTDGTGGSTYTYDSLRRLTREVTGHGEAASFVYDLANNQTSITYPNTNTVNRTFDNAERLLTIRDWLGNTTTFAYSPDSQLTSITFPASTSNVDTYGYDNAGRIASIAMTQGAVTLAGVTYTRDDAGQLQGETQTGLPGTPQTYGYDALNRLVNSGAYAYDAADNPTTLAGASGFGYDAANQLQSGPGGGYGYDVLGQRTGFTPTGGSATSYGYDQVGDLTSVGGAAPASYSYDGDGLRASKTASGSTLHFMWDGSSRLPRLLSDGTTSYVYGPDGAPLEQIDGAGTVSYYHHDQLGSTRLLTGSSGSVLASFSYDPYGNVTGSTGSVSTPLGFAGEYRDAESGLVYMRARYYDPATAQFISRDPLELLTRQPYSYVNDNPLNGADPTGLSCNWASPWHDPLDCARDVGHGAVTSAKALGNYGAGLAAGVSAGYSTKLLNAVGITPDTCSAFYAGAEAFTVVGAAIVPVVGEEVALAEAGSAISMSEAVARGAAHVGGRGEMFATPRGNYQFIGDEFTNAAGQAQRNIARFDVRNLRPGEVPHLNLEVQIEGVPQPRLDPHTPIIQSTVRPGDYP
jgi:RHS repeat-associated protein